MRKSFSSLLVLVGFAVLFSACAQPTQPTPTRMPELGLRRKGLSPSEVAMPWSQPDSESVLRVVSCRTFRHLGEAVHLVGEVENTGEIKMGEVSVEVVGYARGGRVMDTKQDSTYLSVVPPGAKAPFRVFFHAKDVERCELTVTGEPTEAEPADTLEASLVALSAPSSGYSHVKGELDNPGAETVNVTLIIVLRDESGEAVEVHRAKLRQPVEPGSTSFDVLALHHGAATADIRAEVRDDK
ncbi:MAG TPA: FxLYD domain-containing protein [Anaerolineae bacterium]|nr:FxLYD domain-containing protein [Anaerolineae bacterium]